MNLLEGLEPQKVFHFFGEICDIPHGSGNLDRISSYLEKFAQDRGLFYIRDASNNIIIVKNATSGYESTAPIMLQGHMDMVAVKERDCEIDLENDGLRVRTDGDNIYAEGTSLGGDDGIAVAYILAVLDSHDIAHPRIEAVITTDEEIGMGGASAIDVSMLQAKRMLNIDSEEEGILLTSCAGGVRVDCHLPINLVKAPQNTAFIKINISGLVGGHSGTEIHKERGNALKILGITLRQLSEKYAFHLASIYGGEKDNAIAREASAMICTEKDNVADVLDTIAAMESELQNEYHSKEKNIALKAGLDVSGEMFLDTESTQRIITFLVLLPNGVMAMSMDIQGLVETSLNIGILRLTETEMTASCAIRSAVETAKQKVKVQIQTLTELLGGSITAHGEYPGWQYQPDSKLRSDMVRIYRELFGKDVQVEALHAGLECGIMVSKIPGLDCVSFGPDIYDIHTTKERLSISSTKRMWDYLLEILKQK